jgi:hypothetical protein
MKIANSLQHLMFVFVGFFYVPRFADARDNYKEFKRDHLEMELSSQLFRSEANYLTSGASTTNLASGNYYQLIDTKIGGRYIPRNNWSIFASGTVGSAESKNAAISRGNSTMSDAQIGVDFILNSKFFKVIPEIVLSVPFEKVDPATDTVLNNEGVMELRSRVSIQKELGTLRAYGWLGFTYRDEGRSYLMPWGAGVQLNWGRIIFGGEIFGYESVTDDSDQNAFARSTYTTVANAGSLKFYSYNPSLIDTQVYFTWLVSPQFSIQANGGTTLMGSNMAAGYHVGLQLKYNFDLTEIYIDEPSGEPIPSINTQPRATEADRDAVESFREATEDGINQDLFKDQSDQMLDAKPKVVDEGLQQKLDEAEIDVELKNQKKKRKK